MAIQDVPGTAGVINTGGFANTQNVVAPFIQMAVAQKQIKDQDTEKKKADAQLRTKTMLEFAQQYGIFPQPEELNKAIKEGFGFSPMDPSIMGAFQGGSQPLGAAPNAVSATGKSLQNPGMVPNVAPTTPAGTGVVEKGAAGTLVAPPLSPTIDRSAIEDFARQKFGLAAGIAGAQLEAKQRQAWADSYASHVADLHSQALAGDPKAIINYQLIANDGKLDPKLMEALPYLTSPDKRQDLFQVMRDTEGAQHKEERRSKLMESAMQHMGDRFNNPLDLQTYVNDVVDGRDTKVKMGPGKEKFKDTLSTLETMIGDPASAGHIMDMWTNGIPLGDAIDQVIPKNFVSLPRRKQLVEESNALSNRMKAQAEQLTAATGAAKEGRETQAAKEKTQLGAMGSAIDILTSPNAAKLDPEFAKGLEQVVAPYLGLQVGEKGLIWKSPLYTPRSDSDAAKKALGAPQATADDQGGFSYSGMDK